MQADASAGSLDEIPAFYESKIKEMTQQVEQLQQQNIRDKDASQKSIQTLSGQHNSDQQTILNIKQQLSMAKEHAEAQQVSGCCCLRPVCKALLTLHNEPLLAAIS